MNGPCCQNYFAHMGLLLPDLAFLSSPGINATARVLQAASMRRMATAARVEKTRSGSGHQ